MSNNKENKTFLYGMVFLILIVLTSIGIKKYNKYYNNKSIKEIKKNTLLVSSKKINNDNNGKLVLTKGKFNTNYLYDSLFNIKVEANNLLRHVEVYQWVQIKEVNSKGKTVYKYEKVWSDRIIKSKKFKNKKKINPTKKIYKSKYFNQDITTIGAFTLSKKQVKNLPCDTRLKLGTSNEPKNGFIIYDNFFTNSKNPEKPKIGDYRISYHYNNWEYATVLATQKGKSFTDYITKKREKINYIAKDKISLDEIINYLPLKK